MIKLICVTADNNNKYYYMDDLGNGTFEVKYGRIGASETTLTYPISQWDKKYNEKLKKGYIDVSSALKDTVQRKSLNILNKDVKDLIEFLMKCAKQSIKNNYEIALEDITQAQIDTVQDLIDELYDLGKSKPSADVLNAKLKLVYTTIPRKMYDTRKYFLTPAYDTQYLVELLQNEQNRLNTLKSQVNIVKPQTTNEEITLNTLGFSCEVASDEDRELIKKATDFKLTNHKVFKIINKETEAAFNPNRLKTKLLYHGSRNENFLSILQTGLKIRPKGVATTGSMFGDGIYAANKARKSIGYTSLRGSYWASGSSNRAYLAIFEFATGKEYEVLKKQSYSYWMGNLNEDTVKSKGYDSVFAQGGADLRNDEYIVYNSNQCTIRYLIELKED